jgi:tetratricopeptide (TPR) repeat protein
MEKSMDLAPADYKPYFFRGRYLESVRNDFPAALGDFAMASRLNPAHAESWYYQGYCLEASGRREEARGAYETAIRYVEEKHQRFSLPDQGMARLLTDEAPSQALEFARKAVELEPDVDSNHLILAKIYERFGRFSDAEQELQTAERVDPINAAPRFMLARIYSKAGNHKAAEAELEMFRKINRTYGSQ